VKDGYRWVKYPIAHGKNQQQTHSTFTITMACRKGDMQRSKEQLWREISRGNIV